MKRLLVVVVVAFAAVSVYGGDVRLNDRFPAQSEGQLSPPIVGSPIHECAKAVHVSGFIPHATIRVIANAAEVVGTATPYFGFADIALTRELNIGDSITATQEVNGVTSVRSYAPVVVTAYPATLPTPEVGADVYECGRIVPVGNLEPSALVRVMQDGVVIGEKQAAQTWEPVPVSAMVAGRQITAVQVECPTRSASPINGPISAPRVVQPAPPMPKPQLDAWYAGNDTVTMHALLTGAELKVTSAGTTIGGGLATAAANWTPVSPPLSATSDPRATQKLCDVSQPSDPRPASTRLPAPQIVRPLCAGRRSVEIDGTVLNANVVLLRGGAIIGYGGAVPGRLVLSIAPGVTLSEGETIEALQYIGPLVSPSSSAVVECIPQNVVTQHNDNARSGQMLGEHTLTPAAVHGGGFGLLYSRDVDGEVLAQPLYLRRVPVEGATTKNLFFIATSTNHVYAFDADDRSPAAAPVWHRASIESTGDASICNETQPHRVGITSTPVIDPGTRRMYVVARAADGTHHLHMLDVTNGVDLHTVVINGSDRGTDFHPACHRNRPGLLLQKNVVYVAFGTFSCDAPCGPDDPYHGWVMAYRASDLKPLGAFCTTAGGAAAGIWQSGNGLVGIDDGSDFGQVAFETGNEQERRQPLGDSFVTIALRPSTTARSGFTLSEVAHFSPSNVLRLMNGDTDLGSGGPMLLPGNRLIGGGKEGKYYLLRTDMTEVSEFQAFLNTWHLPPTVPAGSPDCDRSNIWADLPPGCHLDPQWYQDSEHWGPNIHSGPVYWSWERDFGVIYQLPEKDVIKGFRYDRGSKTVDPTPMITGVLRQPVDGMPGGFSSVSANNTTNGIVWVSIPLENGQWNNVPGRLVALDAKTLRELWRDTDNVTFSKFCAPTIADGYVIRATWYGRVLVYGLATSGGRSRFRPSSWAVLSTAWAKLPLGSEPEPFCYTLPEKFEAVGGAAAFEGAALKEQRIDDQSGGSIAELSRLVVPDGYIASTKPLPHDQMPACDRPRPNAVRRVPVAIVYSKRTCAHVIEGDLLAAWRKRGGPASKLGYPIADSTITPDGGGRMTVFERGTLIWSPDGRVREAPLPDWVKEAQQPAQQEQEKPK